MQTIEHYNPPACNTQGVLYMKGKICTRSKCKDCGTAFKEGYQHGTIDLYCSCGKRPRTYYLYLYVRGDGDRTIAKDRGNRIHSYEQASQLLNTIRKQVNDHTFDIHDYLPRSVKSYEPRRLLIKWYSSKLKKGLAPTTLRDIKGHIRNHIAPIGAKVLITNDVRDIRTHHIDDFLDRLPARLVMKTRDNIMTSLQSFVNWLIRKELLDRRPEFPDIVVPRPAAKWAPKEYLLQALPHVPEHDRPVIRFMLYHPLRSGEVSALKVKDFLLDRGLVHVCRAWSLGQIRQRKNNKPYYLALSEHFDRSILKSKLPEAFAFMNSIGRPYTSNHLKKIWRKASEAAGIEYIPLKNAGRTSIASDAVNRGVSLYAVADALGNSPEVVAKHYGHLNAESTRKVIDGK